MTSFMSIEQLVDQVCDTEFSEPNYALVLEICDLINQKGKSLPRQAAFAIVRNINNWTRSNQCAVHALTLLDYCVKNCGYPFHLIISTKEFLNELVRRFPERPTNITMVHNRILDLIQTWNATLCQTSRYKDDFKHINDMYRLLQYKGYRFPPLSKDATSALNSEQTFKTEEELQEEDRIAQGAKLQELLRMGTPAALEQANDLMKIMSGYDTHRIPDYKKQVEEEINRIEQRTILLNDMLIQRSKEGRGYRPDTTIEDLLGNAKAAQVRIQKLLESGEEEERMGRLLEVNDLINTVIKKHDDFKAGRPLDGANEQSATAAATSAKETKPQTGPISLIDLDWDAPASGPASGSGSKQMKPQDVGNLLDDLSALSFTPTATTSSPAAVPPPGFNMSSGFGTPTLGTPGTGSGVAGGSGFPFGAPSPQLGASAMPAASQQRPSSSGQQQQSMADPFASLNNAWTTSTPPSLQQPKAVTPDPFANVDIFGKLAGVRAGMSNPGTPPPVQSNPFGSGNANPQQKEIELFNKNGLQIHYTMQPLGANTSIKAQARFINTTPVPFTNLQFLVAVPKSMTLTMEPASANVVPPLNQAKTVQGMLITNPNKEPLRIRYKIQYAVNGAVVNEGGDWSADS
ncbi:hypothetical protein HDU85_001652 [Gaertneriomyces sp. JEL0708]|nr:hypothetical protein HDU85_001652 [Gaertneriomyces sp. JEL0708]